MTLRLTPADGTTANVVATNNKVTATAANSWTLMVQDATADGSGWSYAKTMPEAANLVVTADNISSAAGESLTAAPDLSTCKIWLEKTIADGGTLTEEVPATRVNVTLPDAVYVCGTYEVSATPTAWCSIARSHL